MLRIAQRAARDNGIGNVRFLNLKTEDLPSAIAPLRLATFGASFHWMDRVFVANRLHGLMEPAGGLVAIAPSSFWRGREPWQQVVIGTIRDWLGEERRAGTALFKAAPLHQECLAQTPFADIKVIEIHKTHSWTADNIVGYLYSTSFASKAVLGNLRQGFEDDLRGRLSRLSTEDRFAEEIEFSIISARAVT
jgi:hypothetical protein